MNTALPTRADEALRLSEDHYRVLFDEHPVPMWVYDPATLQFLSVNHAAVAHYGYSREEFLALSIADIRPEEDVDRLVTQVREGGADGSWRHRTKDGAVFDVEIISRELDFRGTSARLVIAVDVTERAKAERELRTAYEQQLAAVKQLRAVDEMKNTFLNAVSHELRTPLSAVVGSAITLKNLGVDLTSDDQREMVGAIAENALKLQRLLSDLLDLDRLPRVALARRRHRPLARGALRRAPQGHRVVGGAPRRRLPLLRPAQRAHRDRQLTALVISAASAYVEGTRKSRAEPPKCGNTPFLPP